MKKMKKLLQQFWFTSSLFIFRIEYLTSSGCFEVDPVDFWSQRPDSRPLRWSAMHGPGGEIWDGFPSLGNQGQDIVVAT